MKEEIENNNNKVEGKDREIKQLQEKLNQRNDLVIEELIAQNEFYKQSIKELTNNVLSIKEEMETKIRRRNDCTDFADAPGIHKINPDREGPFDVLCDSATAGPGWTVIQQRINGKEDFYRDWTTYREGFGSFDGDFFLGLERIHRLTRAQPHELYIHMEGFDGDIKYRRYDQFAISGEEDQYTLITLGKSEGSAKNDYLLYHKDKKFTTYDRDNDNLNSGNCANRDERGGGWWYGDCAYRY
ncbi:angiopoietin-related protein 7-like [Drosophila montana]|uniref:angiopoietin-related protein 7-like n=1 Tax=Drosophila montana TaxID=40370 RepID=UPI00313CB3B6